MQKPTDYYSIPYLTKQRWGSYWYQYFEATKQQNIRKILEVGPGNNIVNTILKKTGYEVKTTDFDEKTNPDYIADIRELPKVIHEQFDLIMCCEVLEHIPFRDVKLALQNFHSISQKYLVITIPYTTLGTFTVRVFLKIVPFLKPFQWIKILRVFPKEHIPNLPHGHHWEIGKKGYPLKRIISLFSETGWIVEKSYPIFENPYHYMFVLKKI